MCLTVFFFCNISESIVFFCCLKKLNRIFHLHFISTQCWSGDQNRLFHWYFNWIPILNITFESLVFDKVNQLNQSAYLDVNQISSAEQFVCFSLNCVSFSSKTFSFYTVCTFFWLNFNGILHILLHSVYWYICFFFVSLLFSSSHSINKQSNFQKQLVWRFDLRYNITFFLNII